MTLDQVNERLLVHIGKACLNMARTLHDRGATRDETNAVLAWLVPELEAQRRKMLGRIPAISVRAGCTDIRVAMR